MGASEEENRQWHVRNERACLDQVKARFRGDGNEVGLIALEKISLPKPEPRTRVNKLIPEFAV